ncbi:MAG TPA: saccharopine dehydrogenase NADP-binding domain-containing protein, partial [Polyangiaceae bacterium]|nr:saccharopine dehydrogenase NADP-binding domain-containing protein [Polyangiaceae bacterium]
MDHRRFDLVVFGATGFTGKLVAEYLARNHRGALRWAIAGRDPQKLAALKAELARIDPGLAELETLLADSADRASLDALARATRVLVTTVGPYMKYGRELASACAEQGTHYADLTGEVPFVRESIERNDARARSTGARIVHSSGFDSIPSDLGVFMLHQHFAAQGRRLARASFFIEALKGGASGGTLATMSTVAEAASRDRDVRRLIGDPYALVLDGEAGPESDRYRIRFEPRIGKWVCPFVMAAINTRVVHRSNALSGYAYGRDFRYSEEMCTGRGPAGFARATAVSGGLGAFVALAATGPGRRVL